MPDPALAGHAAAPARLPGHHGLRRALSQAGLIVALLAVFAVCSAAAGTGALLLTAGNQQALSAAVALADGSERSGGADVTTVFVTGAAGGDSVPTDAATLAPLIRRSLLKTAAPYRATAALWASSPLLFLDGDQVRRGYLVDADAFAANASLRAGSWPTRPADGGRIPVAVPAATAEALGLAVGAELELSSERGRQDASGSFPLVVTGTFVPADTPAWTRDTLQGRGYDPAYLWLPTFGPFVVAPGTLEGLAAPVERVVAVLDPDLAGDAAGVPALVQRVDELATRLQDTAGPAISSVRVLSGLGAEFSRMGAELEVTAALVLAVLVLVLALGAAATVLVGRALAGRRGSELTLLRDRGASAPQLVRGAAAEAVAVAAVAALVAAPLAVAAHQLAAPAAAGAVRGVLPGLELALGVLAGAALPAVVMVVGGLPQRSPVQGGAVPGGLARSGLDIMLAVLAVVAYLQLRTHVPTAGAIDPLLVTAPAICLLAAAALATRLVPLVARVADRAARRGRAFVLPMAAWHLARGGAARGMLLLVLATAVGTVGVTFLGTWPRSQADQAAALVGADLVVGRRGGPGTARELTAATGGTVTPVADHAVVLGNRPEGVRLLALDAGLADRMLIGRPPDGESWQAVMAQLGPPEAEAPLIIDGGPQQLTLTGGVRADPAGGGATTPVVTAMPTLILTDESGATTTRAGAAVALDDRPHTIRLPLPGQPELPPGTWHVVGIDLLLADHTDADLIGWGNTSATAQLSVTVDGASSDAGGEWAATADAANSGVQPREVTLQGATVRASFSFSVLGLSWQDAHLTLLSFPASTQLPVAMTDGLARELGLATGDRIALRSGTTSLEAVVARTVPYVPGHAREAALLTDLRSLQRGLLSAGTLEPATDAWWVAAPRPGAADALRAADRGPVSDRNEVAATLLDGPLRAPLPVAWLLAIAAAIGLAITGSAANAAAEAQSRATTLARVRALGLSQREAFASHLAQHLAVTTAGVLLGAICGVILARLLVPLLVTSPTGERAVPAVTLVWSTGPTAGVFAAILVGGLLAGVPAARTAVRRSTVAALRAGEAP